MDGGRACAVALLKQRRSQCPFSLALQRVTKGPRRAVYKVALWLPPAETRLRQPVCDTGDYRRSPHSLSKPNKNLLHQHEEAGELRWWDGQGWSAQQCSHSGLMQTTKASGSGHPTPCSVSGSIQLEQESFPLLPEAHMQPDAAPPPNPSLFRFQALSLALSTRRPVQEALSAGRSWRQGELRVYLVAEGKQMVN